MQIHTPSADRERVKPFRGAYYSSRYRESMKNLIVPMWTAAELWGTKESEKNFRNCLVGTAEDCADKWRKWNAEGVFEQDDADAYYVLKQSFHFRGQLFERWGIFASLSVV